MRILNAGRRWGLLALAMWTLSAADAGAQTAAAPTVELHRFFVSGSVLGVYLTGIPSNGIALGYFDGPLIGASLPVRIVLPPPSGFRFAGNPGLVPIHQWRVVEGGRTYYWYSPFFSTTLGNNYHYEGYIGYAYPFNAPDRVTIIPGVFSVATTPMQYYYSQSKGYYYEANLPRGDFSLGLMMPGQFAYHGVGFKAISCNPNSVSFDQCPRYALEPIPPPPPCDPFEEQYCYDSGGTWNPVGCYCSYPPPLCESGGLCY
jgi:hypothetical protein